MRRVLLYLVLALILSQFLVVAPVAADPEVRPMGDAVETPSKASVAMAPVTKAPPIPIEARTKIDPALLKALIEAEETARLAAQPAEPVTFLVYMAERADLSPALTLQSVTARRHAVAAQLQRTAAESQAAVVQQLDAQLAAQRITRFQSYWVFNGFAVDGGLEAALALAQRDDVAFLRPNRIHWLRQPVVDEGSGKMATTDLEWNIVKVNADRVWEELGVTGQGVVVANTDSGVDWTHPALQRSYRGYNADDPAASTHDHNWFDPTGQYPNAPGPNTPHLGGGADHGTHTMGTMVGANADGSGSIGMAPGARWIAAKVYNNDGSTTDEWLHAGFQWILAPTDLEGNNPDPSKAPDVVNNSWGDDNGSDETFWRDQEAWNAAGILSYWSAGNAGSGSGTVGSPGSFPHAVAVGATNSNDQIASFSSRGPSPWGEIKPEISAPGVNIRSSIPGGTLESGWNGTSMACPHVAGLAALMLSASGHSLSITSTLHMITTTVQDLGVEGEDNTYGYGRIDAYQAVAAVNRGGKFRGAVRDAASGEPVPGAQITMVNLATGGNARTVADEQGIYGFTVAEGFYDVTASSFGFDPQVAIEVEIRAQTTTQLDFALNKRPCGTLAGRITSAASGAPIRAIVEVLGTPLTTAVDAGGYYTLTVPVGPYQVRILPEGAGHTGLQEQVTIAAEATTSLDAGLAAAPRLLMVDADASVKSCAAYYGDDLDNLLYGHDVWTIEMAPDDNPSAEALAAYDVVIWSHPSRSPGQIGAWDALSAYLDGGGRLLISGQDIGYWDDDKNMGRESYQRYLHAEYAADDGGLDDMTGIAGELLDGVSLTYGTPDSAGNQSMPDVVTRHDGLARPIVAFADQETAGLCADACDYRVVYLSFGLEGTGPADQRQVVISRAIDWLMAAEFEHDARWSVGNTSRVVATGSTALYDLTLVNQGTAPAAYALSVEAGSWEARLVNAENDEIISQTDVLSACGSIDLVLKVTVPECAVPNKAQIVTVRATSLAAPGLTAEATYDITALKAWYRITDMPMPGYRMGCAEVDGTIYAIAGYRDDGTDAASNRVDIYDAAANTWATGADKPTTAANCSAVALDGLVYVIGGYNPNASPTHLTDVEVYDPVNDRWTAVAPLPTGLSGTASAACEGRIYVFGGNTADGDSSYLYVYDPVADAWTQGATLPRDDVEFAQAVALDGVIYLAGGWADEASFYRYTPSTERFEELAPMNVGRNSFALVAAQGQLFVAGGGETWNGLTSAERYYPATDTWRTILPLQSSDRVGVAGIYALGRIYVLGGVSDAIADSVEALDLEIVYGGSNLTVDRELAQPGASLAYTLDLGNPTENEASGSWRWPVPDGLSYVDGSATGDVVFDEVSQSLTWEGTVPAQDTLTFGFEGTLRGDLATGTVVTSTITLASGELPERTLSTTTLVSVPSLAASVKVADRDVVAAGDNIHYTVSIANESPYTITAATLSDPIPTHTTYVAGSLTGDGAIYNGGLNSIAWQGTLPPARMSPLRFDWIDATAGRDLDLGDDQCSDALALGFAFEFYGNTYEEIYVNSNGMVLFGGANSSYGNTEIPNETTPNNFVAPFWDDLRPGRGDGSVYFATYGAAPNRYAVVEWHRVQTFSGGYEQTFEIVLYEGSNRVTFQYLEMTGEKGAGSGATVGIENADGTVGVEYLHNGSPASHALRDELAVDMAHSSLRRASSVTIAYDVAVDAAVPPLTVIENVATIDDGLTTHQRRATTDVETARFESSFKAVDRAAAVSGDTVTFTIQAINSGAVDAVDLALVDVIPNGLTMVPDSLTGEDATYDPVGERIVWHGVITSSHSQTFTYQVTVDEGLAPNTWITNTATLHEGDTLMATLQEALLCNTVDLSNSAMGVSDSEAWAGSTIRYTIDITNSGMFVAEGIVMNDRLPAYLELLPESVTGGTSAENSVRWLGSLSAGDGHRVTFDARIDSAAPNNTIITNTATILDAAGTSAVCQASTRVMRGDISGSDLQGNKDLVLPGGRLELTARILNSGMAPVSATLRCTPPAPLSLVANSLFASSGDIGVDGNEIGWQDTIDAESMVILRFSCDAPPEIEDQMVVVEATLRDDQGDEHTLTERLFLGHGIRMHLPLLFQASD